jgi:hypothetical protein
MDGKLIVRFNVLDLRSYTDITRFHIDAFSHADLFSAQ